MRLNFFFKIRGKNLNQKSKKEIDFFPLFEHFLISGANTGEGILGGLDQIQRGLGQGSGLVNATLDVSLDCCNIDGRVRIGVLTGIGGLKIGK